MVQSILTTILFIAGVAIFLYAPITVFLGQKRGNWDMSTKRILSYLGLSQLGITIALIAWVISDFEAWPLAIYGFLFFAAFQLLQFIAHWLQLRWLARMAKKLREEPRRP